MGTHFSKHILSYGFVCISVFLGHTIFAADIVATIETGLFVPLQPVNLGVTIGDSSVALSWSTPLSDGGTAILDYVVEYKLSTSGIWLVFPDGISTNTFTTLSGLVNDSSYDFRVRAVNGIGQGPASTSVTATPGVPANVFILGMNDVLVPEVTASVLITNIGAVAYEYQYSWCVTDSVLNVCGGGNDVYSSSSSKLIDPGQSWDTTLSATVTTAGTYWFHTDVQYGSDFSYTSLSFTAVTLPPTESEQSLQGSKNSGNVCRGFDYNKDSKVNSIDYAILRYYFNTTEPFQNQCIDGNNDGVLNASDFSIFLTYWE